MNVEEYWQEKERKLGKKIEGKILAKYNISDNAPLWGIIYYTSEALYFEAIPKSKNWFENAITRNNLSYKKETKEIKISLPWNSVTTIELTKKEPLFKRLFIPPDRKLKIKSRVSNAEKLLFIVGDNAQEIINYHKKISGGQ